MIEIDAVTKSYGTRRVVDNLSLTVDGGALCVLLGSSGCGKSTTLRMINRLIPIDSGLIRVGGEDVRQVPAEALRRRIGAEIDLAGHHALEIANLGERVANCALLKSIQTAKDPAGFQQDSLRDPNGPGCK